MRCSECGNENPEGAKFCMKCGTRFSQTCPQCGAGNLAEAVYCEQCGASLVSAETRGAGRRWVPYVAAFIGAVVVVAIIAVMVFFVGPAMGWWPPIGANPTAVPPTPEPTLLPQPTETSTAPTTEPTPDSGEIIPTLPPPLAGVEFPMQAIEYPANWPSELRYPEAGTRVDTSSGTLEGSAEGWGAKLRYQGEPPGAADELSAFFASQGWQVVDRTELDSGGVLLLVQRDDGNGSGVIVLDPDLDNPGTTKGLITVFPGNEPTATASPNSESPPEGTKVVMASPTPEPRGETFALYETDSYISRVAISSNILAFQTPRCECIVAVDLSTGSVLDAAGAGRARKRPFSINGKYIVWEGSYSSPGVRARNLETGQELPVVAPDGEQPAVNASTVVWAEKRGETWDIFGKDLATNQEFTVTSGPGDQRTPAVSGDLVVWSGGPGIQGTNLSSRSSFSVTDEPSAQSPAISGNTVVWLEDCRYRSCDIWARVLPDGEEFLVNDEQPADPDKGVAVDGDLITWVMFELGRGWTVMAKDVGTGTSYRVSGPSLSCDPAAPAASDGLVVWGCNSGGDGGPFGWRVGAP